MLLHEPVERRVPGLAMAVLEIQPDHPETERPQARGLAMGGRQSARSVLHQKTAQLLAAAGVPQLPERLGFYLPAALRRTATTGIGQGR